METEKEEEDPFSSMIKLCHPTSSQESTFSYCPLARESEIFVDPNSSSPDPTPSPPTPILTVTLPDSGDAVPEVEEEEEEESDAVFHTPPEHHLRSSSSEEQNFVDFGDESTRVRVSQRGSDDDSMSKKVGVSDLEEDTMPADDTEEILVEETESVHDTEVIDLDSQETVNLGDDVVMVDKNDPVAEIGGEGFNSVGENYEMEIDGKAVEDIEVNEGEKNSENSDVDGSCGSGKIEEEFVGTKRVVSDTREESGVGGLDKLVFKVTEARESSDRGLRTNVKIIDEIDKFAYVGGSDVERRSRGRTGRGGGGGGRVRQLPVSMKGKEKNVGGMDVVEENAKTKKKSGLLDLLDVLKVVVGDGDGDGGSEDVDFLETAKKRGLTFPRPRWWPPEGEDQNIFG